METTDGSLPDFQTIFQAGPDPYLVVDRNFRIVAVADAYLKATMTRRQDILGRHMFDIFPDNPDETDATAGGRRGRVAKSSTNSAMSANRAV
jgi:PAS domain S-box-containing protein